MLEPRLPPILTTKITAPPGQAVTVKRPRLTDQLEAGLDRKLTLISAPPGFGKTTLVTEWLATYARPERVAWLSLDASDNDPGRFLAYFLSALRTVEPDLGPNLMHALQASLQDDATLALIDIINDLGRLTEPLVCVLDDYHSITDDGIHRALAYLLENQPPALHLIVTTREMPPLSLALLRTRRELTEFRDGDLRFTAAEASAFLNDVMRLDISPQQVQALAERTEGWVAGLLLAALSVGNAPQPETALDSFDGEQRYVFDYLAEEVLRRQTPAVQRFLQRTGVLGRMSAELALALAGEGQARLDYLVEANLFTLPLDDRREWFRYHHLFGEFLSARYRAHDPDGWSEAHHSASRWFEQHGFQYEAAEHALAAGDATRLAELIQSFGREFVRRGRIPTLDRWLAGLPDEMIASHPNLVLIKIWTLMLGRHYETIPEWFERIDMSVVSDDNERREILAYQAVCEATYARFLADLDEIIQRSQAALDYFAALPGPPDPNECVALLHLGSAYRMRGDTHAAIEKLSDAIERGQPGEDLVVELNAMSQLTAAYGELGELAEAEARARAALAREDTHGMRRLMMCEAARMTLATILRQRGQFDEARSLLDDALALVESHGDREDQATQILYYYEQALIEAATGSAAEARRMAAAFAARARDLPFAADALWRVDALEAHIMLLNGDFDAAAAWADQREFPIEEPVRYLNERPAIVYAWIDLERGNADRAERLLQRLIASLTETGRMLRRSEAQLVLAAVYARAGRQMDAEAALDEAVAYAARASCRRLLLDTHPAILELLPKSRQRAADAGLEWPLDDFEGESGATGREQHPIEPLTAREHEVLALLGAGATNREAAERLFVSVGTIKRHTHNIYGKLGVNNRTQAILRSQQLGLLDAPE